MTVEPLLQVHDLHVTFASRRGPLRAVDGVNLDVGRGEVVALVGESGCGKTTLIRTILGLESPTSGTVTFDGRALSFRPTELRTLRRRAQMIFQDPTGALNPRHTIYEAVAEGIRIHRVDGHEPTLVADALARAGLRPPERYVSRYPHEVSGGQRQRVLIAGALALGPQLLLADEPVASLDASIRGEILALLRGLVDETGISIVAVTHDLGLAWNIADRMAVMYLGRLVEVGTTEAVLNDPQHPYSRGRCSPSFPRRTTSRRRSCAGRRRIHGRSPPAAGSTPVVRWSPPARPSASKSSSAAAPRTWSWCRRPTVTSWRVTPGGNREESTPSTLSSRTVRRRA